MSISLSVSLAAPIPNFDELKAQVARWLDRDDLEDQIPVFVQMFEAEANRELRTTEMESTVTFSASDEDTLLPIDYLAMRSIYQEDTPDRPLSAMSATAIRQQYDGTAGIPKAYVLVSGGIRLVPPPADLTLLTMDYWSQIEALSVVNPSNWLLQKHPDAYLFGTLFYAEAYLDNAVRAGQWRSLLDSVFDRINKSSRADRFGAGPLTPSAMRQVPGARC